MVYVQALVAEAGMMAEPQEQPAAFLWDLSNSYEYIPRQKLWDLAVAQGYNTGLLAVTLNMYGTRGLWR